MSEFYAAPVNPPRLGDPALDPPMTVRVERWEDRMRTDVRRAIKTDDGPRYTWLIAVGGAGEVGEFLSDDEVATWPICPAVVNQAAYAVNRAPREGAVRPLVGDMDVDAFKGGET